MSERGPLVESMERLTQNADDHALDRELARAAAAGDPKARRELLDRLLDRVRTTVRYLNAGAADTDDLVQVSLVQILRSAGSFRGASRLETWADRITVRTAMRMIKARRRRPEVALEDLPVDQPGGVDPEDRLSRRQVSEHLAVLLGRLSPERRTVVTLCLVHDYRVTEIAEITGAPLNTVRDRLRVGRKQLRKMIASDSVLADWMETVKR